MRQRRLPEKHRVHFSPVWKQLPPRILAGWILEDRLPAHLHPQLHKWIADPEPPTS